MLHFDLRFEEFAGHLAFERLLRSIEQGRRHLAHEVAGGLIDQEVFLLDADAEGRILECHGGNVGTNWRRFK